MHLSSEVAPVSLAYLPDAQSVQRDDPLSVSYFPGRQASQTSDELAPEFALALPGSQGTHVAMLVAALAELYFPAMQ